MDLFKWEWAILSLVKMAIAKAALDVAPDFIMAIYRIGAGFITQTNALPNNAAMLSIYDSVGPYIRTHFEGEGTGFFEMLALVGPLNIMFIAVFIVGVFMTVMAWARMFEIMIYIAASPLAVAFLPLENSGITKKFFLNFAAVVLQGLIMLVIVVFFNALAEILFVKAEQLTLFGTLSAMLMFVILLATMVVKSGSLAKSILGQA
jgi:hypothetical protein